MKLGFLPRPGGLALADGEVAAALGRRVEAAGAESIWAVEHAVVPDAYASTYPYAASGRMGLPNDVDIPDPLEWLAFVAGTTTSLQLGTAMLILPEHNPVFLAKRLATLDRLSGGRVLAGIGVGWLEEEYAAVGVDFRGRGRRADEYLQAMQRLWADTPATFDGQHVSFADVHSNPRPPRGRVRLLVGGHTSAAARRAGRFADGLYPLGVSTAQLRELVGTVAAAAREAGRDPAGVRLTAVAPRDRAGLEELRELGVERVMLASDADDLDVVGDMIESYRRDVIGAS